mmetsp:Transcript_116021/g.374759  ORF Transcript_116021/g.374759 Transcript_116021/m.374759 type:complete len:255 (-) Transcript_116021:1069-1833(-)
MQACMHASTCALSAFGRSTSSRDPHPDSHRRGPRVCSNTIPILPSTLSRPRSTLPPWPEHAQAEPHWPAAPASRSRRETAHDPSLIGGPPLIAALLEQAWSSALPSAGPRTRVLCAHLLLVRRLEVSVAIRVVLEQALPTVLACVESEHAQEPDSERNRIYGVWILGPALDPIDDIVAEPVVSPFVRRGPLHVLVHEHVNDAHRHDVVLLSRLRPHQRHVRIVRCDSTVLFRIELFLRNRNDMGIEGVVHEPQS